MHHLWDWYSRRRVITRRLLLLGGALAGAIAVLWFVQTPYYITAPGAAIDTSRLIDVKSGQPHRSSLHMLVVTTRPANLLLYLYAKLDHRAELETPRDFLGGIEDYQQYLEVTRRMMADSRETAKAVALQRLGLGRGVQATGVEVTDVVAHTAADGYLQRGDLITAINSRPVTTSDELRTILGGLKAGTAVAVRVQRGGQGLTVTVPTGESTDPARKGQAALGILPMTRLAFDVPVPVTITSGAVTGPSGGLMFTLQIIDQLTPGGITHGRFIAGTGTIEPDGKVGPIGGVRQKVYTAEAAGATVMFVPRANYSDARKVATRLEVVPVDTVADALQWLQAHIDK